MPIRRIAYASPVNPAASGISDYSEELLPYLGQYADLTLYLDDKLIPTNPNLHVRTPSMASLQIRHLSQLARDHKRRPFDAILYHIGNSPVHAQIWRTMQRVPGVVVLHEYILHHFMLQYYANILGDIELYRSEAERRYGGEGARIANLMLHGRFTEAAFDFPFCEDVLACAEGLIAHSNYVIERITAMQPDLRTAHVPMGIPLPTLIDRQYARVQRGIPVDAHVLASFGHINPYKRIDATLRVVQALLPSYPKLRYVLVGSISPNYDLHAAIARAGLQEVVHVTGYVDRVAFEEYVAAADICINLRHPTAGETSASLLRLLGAARPTLVTATGSFTELPAGTAAQVDPDASEGDLIQAYCRLLLENPTLADAIGANARTYVANTHTLDGAARGYMQFLSQRYGWEDPQPLRPPLWDVQMPLWDVQMPSMASVGAIREPPAQEAAKILHPLTQRVGAALAELGVSQSDTELLDSVACAVRDVITGEM